MTVTQAGDAAADLPQYILDQLEGGEVGFSVFCFLEVLGMIDMSCITTTRIRSSIELIQKVRSFRAF